MDQTEIKAEVEKLTGFSISHTQFEEAYRKAQAKLKHIEAREGLCHPKLYNWYLTKLTEEYIRSTALEEYTKDLCRRNNAVDVKKGCQAEA